MKGSLVTAESGLPFDYAQGEDVGILHAERRRGVLALLIKQILERAAGAVLVSLFRVYNMYTALGGGASPTLFASGHSSSQENP